MKNYDLWAQCMKKRLDAFVFTLAVVPEKDYLSSELEEMFSSYLKTWKELDKGGEVKEK